MKTILSIHKKGFGDGIHELLEDYRKYIDILTQLNQSLFDAKIQIPSWEKYIEALTWKFSVQSATLADVLEKTSFKCIGNKAEILDIASLKLLSRSLIENYLIFYYLYIMPKNEKEVEFRVKIYEISGLSVRQNFKPTSTTTIKQSNDEKKQMLTLINEVKNNPFFSKLDSNTQNEIIKGSRRGRPAKLLSWGKLFDESVLKNSYFKTLWSVYSNHAHSEFISILQVRDFYNNYTEEQVIEQQRVNLRSQVFLICIYIMDFVNRYKSAEIVFNTLPSDVINEIKYWRYLGIHT